MLNFVLALSIFLGLFILLFVSIILGRWFGIWQIQHDTSHKLRVVNVAEGALFALLGLLVAFTFTGAYERFEARKVFIIDEANAIDTAYSRIALLAPSAQAGLRDSLGQYLDSRILLAETESNRNATPAELIKAKELHDKILDEAIAATKLTNNTAVTELFIPAINNMFEVASKRIAVAQIHPPAIIFYLLIGLAMLSSFLAGYTTAKSKVSHTLHTISYIAITAFILYVIIDLEFPRVGMIRIDKFDQILIDMKQDMK